MLPVGARLGPFEIREPLGSGGMGDVYQAYDTRLRRTVALKVLRGDSPLEEHESSRLRREARALAAMVHPRICGVHDVGQSDGVEFIVMELLEGRTLAATLSSGFRFTRDGLLTAAEELADGLSAAHERGIIHRDLKPGNIMVTSHGLKIMDFGLAKFLASKVATGSDPAASASESSRGTRRGTLQYMAPEAIDGHDLDERADVFALGAVLHEMATGVPVFAADTASAMIVAIMTREARSLVEFRPDVPTSFAEVVSRCLNKAPSARYKSAVEVHEALSRIRTVRKGGPVAGRTVNESKSGHGHAAGRSKRGLAVLPFLDLSEGSRQDYLADGISEAVITHLGETGRMHVIGWTSASALRGSGLSAAEIGRTLNVDTLVEGSVRTLGDAIAVAVRVIEAHSGLQKWSTTLTQPRADLAELQAAVARAIAQQLASVVPGRRQVRAIDPEAHDAYLRGIFLLNNQPDEWEAACRSELERAIALSPRYAAAHAALSRWYNLSGRLTPTDGVTDHAALAQAEYWARQAVEADPQIGGWAFRAGQGALLPLAYTGGFGQLGPSDRVGRDVRQRLGRSGPVLREHGQGRGCRVVRRASRRDRAALDVDPQQRGDRPLRRAQLRALHRGVRRGSRARAPTMGAPRPQGAVLPVPERLRTGGAVVAVFVGMPPRAPAHPGRTGNPGVPAGRCERGDQDSG